MSSAEGPAYSLRAVDRVCDILDTLASAQGGASLSQIAEAAKLPKSSAFRYLSALESRHYVRRAGEDGGMYQLGVAFRPQHTRTMENLAELGRPVLERLRDELEETVNLGVLDGAFVVHAVVAESPHMMRLAARPGERGYVHSTALGKVLCAGLSEEHVRSILESSGMPALTSATITDTAGYLAHLERVRSAGFGMDDAENQAFGRCVAVPIPGLDFPAGISMSAPADRFPPHRTQGVVDQLQAAARELARQVLGSRPEGR